MHRSDGNKGALERPKRAVIPGCSRAEDPMRLETRIAPLGDESGHDIFRCETCGHVDGVVDPPAA